VEYWLPGFGWTVLESTPPAITEPTPVPEAETDNKILPTVIAVAALTAVVAIFVQRKVRLHLRRKKLSAGDLRRRTLAYWQEAVRFANCLEESPGQNLLDLAEKAKFSQHTLTKAELRELDGYLDILAKELTKNTRILRFFFAIE
jgi:hypothetical protein